MIQLKTVKNNIIAENNAVVASAQKGILNLLKQG